jgi:hypothetical protein
VTPRPSPQEDKMGVATGQEGLFDQRVFAPAAGPQDRSRVELLIASGQM